MLKKGAAIRNNTLRTDEIQNLFNDQNSFDTKAVMEFYRQNEPGISSSVVNWRIYSLVQNGILARIGHGKFILGTGKLFIPEITPPIKTLYSSLHKQFAYVKICVWNTSLLNEFMLHQPVKFMTLIEVENDAKDAIFYFLSEKKKNVLLDPTEEILNRYGMGEKETLIVKSLVSESPTQQVGRIETTTLEKVLVDVFTDSVLFAAHQGSEMRRIFSEAYKKYTINESKLLRYANRKGKKNDVSAYVRSLGMPEHS